MAAMAMNPSLTIRRVAILALLVSPSGALAAPPEHAPSELIGTWRGTSVCTDRVAAPACKDEVIVYDFSAGAKADTVHWKADKIVEGKREPMGESDLVYDGGEACWKTEFESPRAHVVWCLIPKDAQLKGSAWLLPKKQVVRRVDAQRK
jgi:hypothetical protein